MGNDEALRCHGNRQRVPVNAAAVGVASGVVGSLYAQKPDVTAEKANASLRDHFDVCVLNVSVGGIQLDKIIHLHSLGKVVNHNDMRF